MSSKEKLLLIVLACVNFTHIMDFMILMPLGPQLIDIFDINTQQFGFLVATYGVAAAISGFTLAFFADRFDRKKVLLFAYIGFVVGTFACAISPTFTILISARTITGLFGGMIGSQVLSIVADAFPYERRASAMGIIMMAFSLASVIGVPGGLYLATKFSWHAPFFTVGGLGIIVMILIWAFVPNVTAHLEQESAKQKKLEVLTNILKTPNQLWALALSVVIMLGHFSIIPYIAPSLVSNIGYKEDQIFLIYLVGGLLTIFSAPLVGKLADKRGKFPIFVTFAILSCIPIFLITNLIPTPIYVVLTISGLFFIFSNGRLIPTQAMVSGVVTPKQRGGFMAINSSVQLMAQAIASSIGGLIIIQREDGYLDHYDWVGYYAISMILLSIFIARKIKNIN
ncbi:MFS transporter [Arcticibacterium luteifluviistationis]|uniref:MFS transporter n=1 Tax=Arcticibacterium luteifluviistationis TaxID=1784714 RepID=A0A2Z4GE15_9BACT|nr:MFS transporter [Arcticibacterium luteifluviistationis]AWV99532.1 MFS transporter [Arcticibacterium luteifluviistationis]